VVGSIALYVLSSGRRDTELLQLENHDDRALAVAPQKMQPHDNRITSC
jgi:hypothetical protein